MPTARILLGDARTRLGEIPNGSVQTCITSPPYFGLRDYGTATWEGGNEDCEHTISMDIKWNDPKRGTAYTRPETSHRGGSSDECHLCGATRIDDQIGLEDTPEDYVAELVELFREVRRVLRSDGTLWLNLGDSYASSPASGGRSTSETFHGSPSADSDHQTPKAKPYKRPQGLKPKDLIGIPWMVAFALRADGWYLRQDIIWSKPNAMPESVRDRCTKSHEHLFLLSKSKNYFFDNEAIFEDAITGWNDSEFDTGKTGEHQLGRAQKRHWTEKSYDQSMLPTTLQQNGTKGTPSGTAGYVDAGKRNKRDVWTISTQPYKGAHFAVMPEALVEPCVMAGSAEGDMVLDPFAGSGTVGVVALKLSRHFLGCELNPAYAEIAQYRIADDAPLFNEVEIA